MGPEPMEGRAAEPELDKLMNELLTAQIMLGDSIQSTSQFLRFALGLANENLVLIRTQLEKIRELASAIENLDRAS